MNTRLRCARLLLGLALVVSGVAAVAAPSSSLTLTGVSQAATYDAAALQALPATTQTVTFQSGGGSQTHTYVGTSLWGMLNSRGIALDPAVKNDVLNRVVMTTGSDGYRAVVALGELNPNFGNRPDLVAYAELVNGTAQPLGADGFARTTAVGDIRGGRYVSNLVNIDLRRTGSTAGATGGGRSTSFAVSGAVSAAMTFDLAALHLLPAVQRTVGAATYTGVSFWDLLNTTVGLSLDPAVKNDVLHMYVVATGSDGYKAAFSLGELNPAFGNQPDIIAYAVDGAPLTDNGFARIVVPNDVRAGRYVSNLASLEVFHALPVPEPASWLLLSAGVFVVAMRRRAAGVPRC